MVGRRTKITRASFLKREVRGVKERRTPCCIAARQTHLLNTDIGRAEEKHERALCSHFVLVFSTWVKNLWY